jgi:prephenate dehydrogenase
VSYRTDTVVILGLGLIGGSLARALRETGFSSRFIGYGKGLPTLERGVELGVIDDYTQDLPEAIDQADILVIAAPTLVAAELLADILPRAAGGSEGPLITDVASVKGNLFRRALEINGSMPPNLVLGHPIAGSERSGVGASDGRLFHRHRVILTPDPANDPEAVATIRRMWEATGAEVVDMDVEQHDRVLAATSHLPHALAYALVDALAQSDASEDIFRFAAGGFRDFTRIASSDPVMWKDIALANREALLAAVDDFSTHLDTLRGLIANGDADGLLQTFSRAKRARDEFAAILAARQANKP